MGKKGWRCERYELLDIRQAQGDIVQHGEKSQKCVTIVNGM